MGKHRHRAVGSLLLLVWVVLANGGAAQGALVFTYFDNTDLGALHAIASSFLGTDSQGDNVRHSGLDYSLALHAASGAATASASESWHSSINTTLNSAESSGAISIEAVVSDTANLDYGRGTAYADSTLRFSITDEPALVHYYGRLSGGIYHTGA